MKLTTLTAGIARLALPLCLGATAVADVIYVDASGNGQYTSIQAAIDAAADGDVLLVRTGTYAGFTLDNRALWVVADAGALPKVTNMVTVRNVASSKAVLLSGLEIAPFNNASFTEIALKLEGNASHVRVQGCTLRGSSGGPAPIAGGAGASILNSMKVAFVGCSLYGGHGGGVPLWVSLGGKGGDGATTQGSIVAFYDCLLKGGVGGDADYTRQERAGDGGDGCHVLDYGILASGCQFQGGMGGGYATIPGKGGNGLRVDAGQAQYIGSTFAGGLGGMSYFGNAGASGLPQTGSGVFNQIAGSARKISAPALAAENSTVQVQLSGEPGDRFWLLQSRLPEFVYSPAYAGVRLVLQMALSSQVPHATLTASGTATVPIFVPDIGPGTPVARQYWQCIVLSSTGQVRLGSALHVAVLNCSDLLPDCNGNGSCDSCDLLAPNALDCDRNGVPDSCQPDCNGNSIADTCDIANGLSADTNSNGIPDECEPHSTWYVDSAAAPGGNGTPSAPYRDLATAFAAASSGDTVLVAPGTYQGSGNRNLEFGSRALIVRSLGIASNTIVDCQGQGRGFRLAQGVPPGARIEGLWIRNGVGSDGGGIDVTQCSPLIRGCMFENCQGGLGGAIRLSNSNAKIERCSFLGNTSPAYGGAINSSGGAPRYLDCGFIGNHAQTGGGAVAINASDLRVERCAFLGNSANTVGGAFHGFGTIRLDQCLIAGNSAANGGGIALWGGPTFTVSNCTIVGNSASSKGGAVHLSSGAAASWVFRNNVIWNNVASAGTPIELGNGSLDFAWNDLQGGQASILVSAQAMLLWGAGNSALDPVFVDPDGPDNNPLTVGDNDYRLFLSSPCLDAGENASVALDAFDLDGDGNTAEPVPFDLDGNARFVDVPSAPNTGSGTPPLVDLGAWERP